MPLLLHDEMVLLHDVRGLLVPAIRQHGMQPEIDTNPTPLWHLWNKAPCNTSPHSSVAGRTLTLPCCECCSALLCCFALL